jgi:hypothetical protein
MIKTIIERLDGILAVGGGVGTGVIYNIEVGIHSIGVITFQSFITQCGTTLFLAILAGIGGWIGGKIIKAIHKSLSKKNWYCKIFKIKKDDTKKI